MRLHIEIKAELDDGSVITLDEFDTPLNVIPVSVPPQVPDNVMSMWVEGRFISDEGDDPNE